MRVGASGRVEQGRRFVIAAGTATYDHHAPLLSVPDDLKTIVHFFTGEGYQEQLTELRLNPTSTDLRGAISLWLTDGQQRTKDDVAVIYYSGHGATQDPYHYLLTAESDQAYEGTALSADFFVRALGSPPKTRRLLIILDACYSGQGALNLVEAAARMSGGQELLGEHEGVWVIAASRPREEADQGAFANTFRQAVQDVQEDAGGLQQFLSLDSIVDRTNGLLAELDVRQRVSWAPASLARGLGPFLPNHNYEPDAPAGVDLGTRARLAREISTHWEPKSRGVEVAASAGWYFMGRTTALREVVAFASGNHDSRLRVVTGDPGSGKSALLGRLVLLSDPGTRPRVPVRDAPPDTIPEQGSVTVALLARGKTVAGLMVELADQLELTSGEDPIQALIARQTPALIVIDALDEATNPQRVIEDVIKPLQAIADGGTGHRLLVATRRPWVPFLPARRVEIDLDDPAYLRTGDIADYVSNVLTAADDPASPTPYREHSVEARNVAEEVARIAGRSYLIAQVGARILTNTPGMLTPNRVRSSWRGWAGVGQAFDADLARYGAEETRVRDLLIPLAWSRGAGLPREIWADVATQIAGNLYTSDDIAWVLSAAGAYIAEALEDDRSVYRLYHQEFADHLRKAYASIQNNRAITGVLLDRVPTLQHTRGRDWLAAHPYVRSHLASHAAACSMLDELVTDPGFLIAAAPEGLLPALRSITSPEGHMAAATYEAVTPYFERHVPGRAAAQLELAARQQHADGLAERVNGLPYSRPWAVPWANWTPEDRNLIVGRHTGWVRAVAVGEIDSRPVVVSAGEDATLRIWDLATGQSRGEALTSRQGAIHALALGRINNRPIAVTGHANGRLCVWDLTTGQTVGGPMTSHMGAVHAVAIGEIDGHPIALSAGDDDKVRVWDLDTHKARGNPLLGHNNIVQSVALGEIGSHPIAISGGLDGAVLIWDLTWRHPRARPLLESSGMIEEIAFGHVDGHAVAVIGGLGRPLRVLDVVTGQTRGKPMAASSGGVHALAFSEIDGHPVVLTGGTHVVQIWDLATGQTRQKPLIGHTGQVLAVAFGQIDGHPVAVSGGVDRTVRVWDLASGQTRQYPDPRPKVLARAVAVGRIDGQPIAITAGDDHAVHTLDLTTGRDIRRPLTGHTRAVSALAIGEVDGHLVAVTGADDHTLRIWDLESGRARRKPIRDRIGSVYAVATGHVGGHPIAITASADLTVRTWDLATGKERGTRLFGHIGAVRTIAVGEIDGQPVAITGGDDQLVMVWDLVSGRAKGSPLVGHEGAVRAVALTQVSGRPVAVTGGTDHTVRVWDLAAGSQRGESLIGHSGVVRAVATAHINGRSFAVTGGSDGTLRLWDLDSGLLSETVGLHSGISSIAATPDGTAVISTNRGLVALKLRMLENNQ
jgi:WD40 repeat protein